MKHLNGYISVWLLHRWRRPGGFTLMESLIAITIVSILAALPPALSNAKSQTAAAKGINAAKQWSFAWVIDSNNSGDGIPMVLVSLEGTNRCPGWLDFQPIALGDTDLNLNTRRSIGYADPKENSETFNNPKVKSGPTHPFCMNRWMGGPLRAKSVPGIPKTARAGTLTWLCHLDMSPA